MEVDVEDHHGHCNLGDQYCAAISGAGCPGTAIGTLTPGDIKPAMVRVVCLRFNSGIRGSRNPSAKGQAASAVSAVDTHRWRWRSGCTD